MRFRALLAVGAVFFLFAGCAKDRLADSRSRYHNEAERQKFTAEHNLGHLPQSDVPLTLNDRVYAWMDYFQGAGRGHFQRYLDRSGRYMKMMRDILKQNGLPQDLIYVAMIESGFNNNAYSRAAAVGPWQFIRGTGSRYDLDINGWEDERRDPVKATWAASRYLRDLYNEFGDWYLAMAGYNAGEGRIREAIANSGSRNFWVIADSRERHLRAETRDYVPKFIAAAIIAKMPQNFGFSLASSQKPLEYDVASVETQTDLEVIADCAGVSPDAVSDLNPHLVRGATPPGARNYQINLPKGTTATFKTKYASLPESERVKVVYHRVRRGENVATIAKRYGVSKGSLIAANDISTKHKLRAGTMLVVPRGRAAYVEDSSEGETSTVRTKKLVTYRVKKMDSVSQIARKFGVTPAQLKSWNSITAKNPLRAGRTLKIYKQVTVAKKSPQGQKQMADAGLSGGGTKHSIRSGDTLWTIAQRYDMSVDELAAMNGLDSSAKIKPGQKIIVKMAQGKTAIEASGDAAAPEAAEIVVKDEPVQGSVQPEAKESPQSTEVREIAMAAASEASPDDIDLSANDTVKKPADKKPVAVTKKYTMKKGDSLGAVAKKHGVTVSDIMKWNGIKNPKVVRSGQVLKIKTTEVGSRKPEVQIKEAKKAPIQKTAPVPQAETVEKIEEPAAVAPVPQKEEGSPIKLSDIPLPEQQSRLNYKVKDGDTLWDIARRHKVTIADIQQWNNLSDPSAVKPGDSLKIHTN